jgi:hypothetical protein
MATGDVRFGARPGGIGPHIKPDYKTVIGMPHKHVAAASPPAISSASKSVTASLTVVGCGTDSLRLGLSSTSVPEAVVSAHLAELGKLGEDRRGGFVRKVPIIGRSPWAAHQARLDPRDCKYILRPAPMSTSSAKFLLNAAWPAGSIAAMRPTRNQKT